MTSMEDLISSLTGGMHVSQEGYDIRALQEYLRATLPIPNGPRYPTANHAFKPAPSRAPSATRKPQGLSVPHDAVMGGGAGGQPMPAPMLFSLSESMYGGDVSGMPLTTPVEEMYEQARPANLRRASSYGVASGPSGMPVTPPQPPLHDAYAYEHDAFAPLIQQQAPLADPWARFRQASQQAAGGNAVAGPSSSGSAFGGHFTHRTPPSGEQRLELEAPATYNGEYNNADGDDYDMMEEDEAEAWLGEADEPHHDTGLRLGLGGIASEHDRRASYSSQQLDMHSTGWRHMPGVEVAQRPVSEPGFSWDRGRRQF